MGDSGKGYELVRGRLRELNVSTESSRVGGKVFSRLEHYCEAHPVGWAFPADTGFRCFATDPTDPNRVRKPDAAFVSFASLPVSAYSREGFCEAVPDIAVEVVSPNDLAREVDGERGEWLRAGVKEVWIIYPDTRTVQVYRAVSGPAFLEELDTLAAPDLLPGFAVPVADLFRLPPAPPVAPPA
jgi:Uma2 family endonuclease